MLNDFFKYSNVAYEKHFIRLNLKIKKLNLTKWEMRDPQETASRVPFHSVPHLAKTQITTVKVNLAEW